MILIEKTTVLGFDDVAERARIESCFKGRLRKDLLEVLDAFVVGDFAKCYKLVLSWDKDKLEYLSEAIQETLPGVHEQLVRQAKAEKLLSEGAGASALPFGRGTEIVAYPKFTVLAEGKPPVPATVPKLLDLKPIIEEKEKRSHGH